MATVHDLIEVSGFSEFTTYSTENGNLLGIVDNASSAALNDGEFDEGDVLSIGGTNYTITEIEEPGSSGTFLYGDGSSETFDPGSESNLDVVFLTVSNGGTTRYFIVPNDSYGSFNLQSITTGQIKPVAGSDAAVVGTSNDNVNVVCFASGTPIAVPGGKDCPIERLKVGDLVSTADRGAQAIRWIGSKRLGARDLAGSERLRPIRISAGALGSGLPFKDVVVSPQHRVLIRARGAGSGVPVEWLIAAKFLTGLKGIALATDLEEVRYFHILLEQHDVVFAGGAPMESLYTGPWAMEAVGAEARAEIMALFPQMGRPDFRALPARPFAVGQMARDLALSRVAPLEPVGFGFEG